MAYKDEIKLIKGEQQYQRIIGLFDNNWAPLFDTYEKENDLFRLDDEKSLRKYNNIISYLSNNYSCSAKEVANFSVLGSSLKDIYKTKKSKIDYNKIIEVLQKNKYKDTFERIKKNQMNLIILILPFPNFYTKYYPIMININIFSNYFQIKSEKN